MQERGQVSYTYFPTRILEKFLKNSTIICKISSAQIEKNLELVSIFLVFSNFYNRNFADDTLQMFCM